ncbi:MAG: hypothetical protein ACJAYU_004549 [Bradymonadia bacterium]|jgi:hypothetical protein
MSQRVIWPVVFLVASCSSSASSIRETSILNAEVLEREMDTLYECGVEEAERRSLAIERSDPVARVYQTAWELDGEDRWRLTVLIQVHPRFGPGAHAVITRDQWVGDSPQGALDERTLPNTEPGMSGWVRARGASTDSDYSAEIGSGIRLCWEGRSPLAN